MSSSILLPSQEKISYVLGKPILSIDTKKKEAIGENCREGSAYATGANEWT